MLAICVIFLAATAVSADDRMGSFDLGILGERVMVTAARGYALKSRMRIPLSGEWAVQPVFPGPSDEFAQIEVEEFLWPRSVLPARDRWLLTTLPGNWRKNLRSPQEDVIKELSGKPITDYTAAWLVKEVELPPAREGQKVLLYLDAVWGGIGSLGGDEYAYLPSHVYVNGNYAGSITAWRRLRFHITPAQIPDGRMQVAILNGVPGMAGNVESQKVRSNAMPAGFFNPAFVEVTQPTSLFVDEVLITPSVRERKLSTAITVVSDAAREVKFTAQLYDVPVFETRKTWPPEQFPSMRWGDWQLDPASLADAQPVAQLVSNQVISVREGQSEVAVTFPCSELECWSPANPRLYWLSIETKDTEGNLLDASVPVTFGFREIWVDGPDILLNGMKINIFGTSHNYYGSYIWTRQDLAGKHHLGLTMDRTQSTWWRAFEFADDAPALSDRWGHFFSCDAHRKTDTLYRYLNNHPSFVMWQYSGNGFVNGPHSHPMQIGGVQEVPKDETPDSRRDAIAKAQNMRQESLKSQVSGLKSKSPRYQQYLEVKQKYENVRQVDPSRPVFFYRLGWGGDIRAIMAYLDVNEPVMDMMDWPLAYYENAKQRKIEPFMGAEVSFTLAMPGLFYWSAPTEAGGVVIGRLGHLEHAARLLGDEAYGLIEPEEIVPQAYANPRRHLSRHVPFSQLMTRMYLHLYEHVFPAWRSCGLSFLLHIDGKPSEHYKDYAKGVLSQRGKAFKRVLAPVMGYIAGPGDDFNALDHAYSSGQIVRKQLILFNDTFQTEPMRMKVEVKANLDGEEIFSKSATLDVENGRRAGLPIEFAVREIRGRKTGTIQARVNAGGQEMEVKPFVFQVFGESQSKAPGNSEIALIDPIEDTAGMLDKAKVSYRKVAPHGDFGQAALLIIGRNAYTKDLAENLNAKEIRELLQKGGSVIVFEQQARQVAGLTNEHFNIRRAFIRDRDNPLFQGLDNEDFAYWRGESNILEPYQHFDKAGFPWETEGNWAKHGLPNRWGQRRRFVPQWSNRNMVATFCYQKPQAGNFRVLLDCGFDNLFTPLVEFDSLGGKVLLCQLDLTNRYGFDPVITRLVDRMLKYYTEARKPKTKIAAIFGDATTRSLAQKLGFRMAKRAETLDAARHAVLLQPGAVSPEEAAEVVAFVRDGGTCVVLGASEENDLADLKAAGLIGFDYAVGTTDSIVLKDPPELLAGIGPSDFFYRRLMAGILAGRSAPGWTGASGLVSVAKVGKGQVVYIAVRPEVFQVEWSSDRPIFASDMNLEPWQETEVYWPTTKFYRVLSTVLSNADAGTNFFVDLKSLSRSGDIYVHQTLDFDPMESYTW